MNPEMQTTLLNTFPRKLVATILKALREQLKENDQLNAVGRFWDDLPKDIVFAARLEEIDWVHSEGVYEIVPMQECRDADMKTVGPDLGGHRQVCGSDTQENSIEVVYKRMKQGKIQRALSASQLFSAMPSLEAVMVLVSIMMSVNLSNKRETIAVETLGHQQSTFPRTSLETH